jgi:hypothetical protein
MSEFSEYVSMLPSIHQGQEGRVDVIVDGRARVDAALASLPVLVEYGGMLYVHDWPKEGTENYWARQCYRSLLQWFTVVDEVDNLRVLRPRHDIISVLAKGVYDWCFVWHSGNKLIEVADGPTGSAAVEELIKKELNCVEEEDRVCLEPLLDKEFFLEEGCIPCKVILESVVGRGDLLVKARKEIINIKGEL